MQRAVTIGLAVVALSFGVACSGGPPSAQEQERQTKQRGFDELVADQPAKTMPYSPTRNTINGWVDTWGQENKPSYVYLQNPDGEVLGYYVFKGLPVSYCAQNTQTYEVKDRVDGDVVVPAPALDGAYYSGSGSCDTYYGFDYTTGAYFEYTAGMGINVFLSDKPMPGPNFEKAEPLGNTSRGDV